MPDTAAQRATRALTSLMHVGHQAGEQSPHCVRCVVERAVIREIQEAERVLYDKMKDPLLRRPMIGGERYA